MTIKNIDTLYRKVGRKALNDYGISSQQLSDAKRRGYLPARWYDLICRVCQEAGAAEPSRKLFNFVPSKKVVSK